MPELSVDAEHLRTSVVIPVKDDAPLLARCLDALAAQTVPPDEVIVVDNCSTDDSAAMALAAGARVIPCPVPGIPAAASAGYDAARGALVLRLDADCVPAPTWVAEVREAFSSAEQVAAFTGRAHFTDGPRALRAPLSLLYLGAYAAMTGVALGHLPLFGSNLAFRRSAWEQVKGDVHREDAEVHDDLDLAFHLGDAFTIARLPGSSMGMSMRPLTQGAFGRRVRRGFRSVMMHWPEDFPPRRWRRLVARRRLAARHRRATPVRASAGIAA